MKKLLFFTLLLIFIPFFIVNFLEINKIEEIKINYVSNMNVRVKQLKTDTVINVPLEEYVVGVLAGEMPISFEKEALKAQAVASRSYVLKRIGYNKDNEYDVVDSVNNQVFLDENYLKEAWGEDYITNINKLRTIVNETMDEYLEYDGEIADCLFFSTSNGYTEDSNLVFSMELPYLQSVDSKWDEKTSTVFNDTSMMSLQEFYEKLGLEYDKKLKVEVISRSDSNRILELKINNTSFTGRQIYEKLKIRSTDFEINQINDNVQINTTGYGHGVGMSQYGAQGMALEGYSYEQILYHYYTGTKINKIS